MVSFTEASIILLAIWFLVYYCRKDKSLTSKKYYILLFIMGAAGILLPMQEYLLQVTHEFNAFNIVLFAFLLLSVLLPWSKIDAWKRREYPLYRIKNRYIGAVKIFLLFIIFSAIFAYVYCMPYAIMAYKMGGSEVRLLIADSSLMPENILSTICYAVGYLAPIQIVCFYLCLIDDRLNKFRFWVFLASLSYIVTTAPIQARDGFIFIPLTYLFLYPICKNSINRETIVKFKRVLLLIGGVGFLLIATITFSRFSESTQYSSPIHGIIYGTYGYFYQQPYVFDNLLEYVPATQGLSRRFPLLCKLFDIPIKEYIPQNALLEQSFSTMYGSFYMATGFSSLIIASLFFVISWSIVFSKHISRKNTSSLIICYSVFIYHVVSGLFYFRFSQESPMSLYLIIIVISFFLPNIIEQKSPKN